MCGIAGIISNASIDPRLPRAMIESLRHRGPDHVGVETLAGAAIATARLSIVDIDAEANQPFWDTERRFVISFNGEIYNFHEIRSELDEPLRTKSDTEVVLAAYKKWGAACLHRFNGMFAFAIWDTRDRILFVARDRFGVKPLFTRSETNRFLFASEMKAILAAGVPAEINLAVVRSVVTHQGADRGTLATFAGIESLPAGHCAIVRAGDPPRVTRWWRLADHLVDVPKKRMDRVALFRETLQDATRLRLRTDVDSAISLSSGLDSSSIYASYRALLTAGRATRATTAGATTLTPFTVSWPGDAIDEAPAACALAKHFGDRAVVVTPRPDDFAALARKVIWHQETIPWNAAILAYHLLYAAIAAHGAKVVLEGHGSDEMLAGYPQFSQIAYRDALRHLRPIRALRYRRSLRLARNVASDSAMRTRLFADDFYKQAPLIDEPAPGNGTALRRSLHRAWTSQVLPTILRIFDRASMSASVESRAPFLDWRLVALVFSLPDDDIIRDGRTKWIQREAMRGSLPREVIERRGKNGFAMPLPLWFRSPAVTNALREALADGSIARADGLEVKRFEQLLDDEVRRGFTYSGSVALWQAYAYAQLRAVFADASIGRTA